ncbi:hypothetical protein Q4551_04695 [Oceanobacter sp. 5_MG-2023]|uniref:hypothetical protein n=1 Tax=Oceanobacter sp. 5_MG-2023 TaxID=3062645 RepID=UPI0026E30E0E|nr:hypothetical protein [Oceanobacter sp. 5_MG-2023]MDO6681574.1 hypothetical protein [Oceanobacter sp. 5_MG-2023]
MDLPSNAIYDLDYCFIGAIKYNFLQETNQDLLDLKALLPSLVQSHNTTLNGNGLPQKNSTISAAGAFEFLASQVAAIPLIESLHEKMKAQNIWIWKKGAIEAHIGITSKNEIAWAKFKNDVIADGLAQTCNDCQGLLDLVEWLRNDT